MSGFIFCSRYILDAFSHLSTSFANLQPRSKVVPKVWQSKNQFSFYRTLRQEKQCVSDYAQNHNVKNIEPDIKSLRPIPESAVMSLGDSAMAVTPKYDPEHKASVNIAIQQTVASKSQEIKSRGKKRRRNDEVQENKDMKFLPKILEDGARQEKEDIKLIAKMTRDEEASTRKMIKSGVMGKTDLLKLEKLPKAVAGEKQQKQMMYNVRCDAQNHIEVYMSRLRKQFINAAKKREAAKEREQEKDDSAARVRLLRTSVNQSNSSLKLQKKLMKKAERRIQQRSRPGKITSTKKRAPQKRSKKVR